MLDFLDMVGAVLDGFAGMSASKTSPAAEKGQLAGVGLFGLSDPLAPLS
jgi:hypothetical protein